MDLSFYVAAVPAVVLLGLSKGGFSGVGMLATPLVALVISRSKQRPSYCPSSLCKT